MTRIVFDNKKFYRYTSLDIITEIGGVDYDNFVENFDEIAPNEVKDVFNLIEDSIGFEKFEKIFLEYIKINLNFSVIDIYQLQYLFHYEIDEVFENAEEIVSKFTSDIGESLYSGQHLVDTILDIIKYHIIGNRLDKTGTHPLYSDIPKGAKAIDAKDVVYREKVRKLPISKFKWLLFLLLMTKHDLFMYRDGFTKKLIHQITNQHIIQDQIYMDAYVVNVGILFERVLLFSGCFSDELFIKMKKIMGENFNLGVAFSMRFNDMFASREIGEEFMNSQITGKLKDGKPFFFEVGTKTKDVDFKKWKEKLGFNRKIEENTEGGRVKSLTVKKKYKYGKKENKGYSFFAIPGAKEGI